MKKFGNIAMVVMLLGSLVSMSSCIGVRTPPPGGTTYVYDGIYYRPSPPPRPYYSRPAPPPPAPRPAPSRPAPPPPSNARPNTPPPQSNQRPNNNHVTPNPPRPQNNPNGNNSKPNNRVTPNPPKPKSNPSKVTAPQKNQNSGPKTGKRK